MIAQYTQAGIVSELKRLAAPGIRRLDPDERDAGGPRLDGLARRRASCAARSTGSRRVLAIELLTAARGIELRGERAGARDAPRVIAALRDRRPGPRPRPLPRPRDRGAPSTSSQSGALLRRRGIATRLTEQTHEQHR